MAAIAAASKADPIEDFYRGKTLRMLIGYGPGGGYDLYGRLVAEFLPRFIPGNPTSCRRTCRAAAASSRRKFMYEVAPKDGTVFGSLAQTLALDSMVNTTRQDRRHAIPLSRAAGHQHRHRRGAAEKRHQLVRGRAQEAIRRRRVRRRLHDRAVPIGAESPMPARNSSWCAATRARPTSSSRWSAARSTSSAPMDCPACS